MAPSIALECGTAKEQTNRSKAVTTVTVIIIVHLLTYLTGIIPGIMKPDHSWYSPDAHFMGSVRMTSRATSKLMPLVSIQMWRRLNLLLTVQITFPRQNADANRSWSPANQTTVCDFAIFSFYIINFRIEISDYNVVLRCDATEAPSQVTCKYKRTVGTDWTNETSTHMSISADVYAEIQVIGE